MFGKSILNHKTMSILCRQLASAYEAGIPIIQSLQIVGDSSPTRKLKFALYRASEKIMSGETLVEAFKEAGIFPDLFIRLVATGERSGKLDIILKDLSTYYEDLWKIKRATISSLIYPGIQLALGWFLGTFALGIVQNLDLHSHFTINKYISDYVSFQIKFISLFLIGCILITLLTKYWNLGNIIKNIFSYIWPFSRIVHKLSLARFFKSFALLYSSGITITESLQRSAELLPSFSQQNNITQVIEEIKKGSNLEKAFRRAPWIGRVAQEMITIGEQSGKLDETLHKLSEYALRDAEYTIRATTKILNVLVMLIVGAIIGFIVITFYANLYGNMLNSLDI
ncbi:MAG: type II secretion system F family protein [Candidatus Hydrogenedentes bacterium]|nr:type II secretion system F family protein [Candidatus Hydrogenedentota bacterium]